MEKTGFDLKISKFFSDYLVSRKTQYTWNNFSSPFFDVNVGVGQGSALSPILSALYLSFLFHIFKKQVKNLKIPVSLLYFVDDRLFISQRKYFEKTNLVLFCNYNIFSSLLNYFSLTIEHSKTEVFHFTRFQGAFNLPLLNLSSIRGPNLIPNSHGDIWA